jgi:putative ABC transport system substrate-binding protein
MRHTLEHSEGINPGNAKYRQCSKPKRRVKFFSPRTRIVDFAAQSQLPAIYMYREWADAGGFMAYGASLREVYRRVATLMDKILKGAKPADLPIEQPMTFELIINLKTAQALGLTIPPTLLFQADEVIR